MRDVHFKSWQHAYTSYDLAGNLLTETLIDGRTLTRTYDRALRPLSLKTSGFTQEIQEYDPVGNPLSMDWDGKRHTYTYDERYQLTSEEGESCHTYRFDALHNRLSKDDETYTPNALQQIPSHCLYDLNGNPIQLGDFHLTYDALGRLIQVETPETTLHLTYDFLNRCLRRQEGNQTLHFLYDGQNEIGSYEETLQTFRVLGRVQNAEIGAAVLLFLNGAIYTPLHDLQGNLTAVGSEKYRFTAFGEEKRKTVFLSPWRFSSKRVDPTTHFVNYGRRYYVPALGRWLTPDPLGLAAGSNLYAFLQNAPFIHLDTYGLFDVKPYHDDPEKNRRLGVAGVHELGHQMLEVGHFIASSPYYLERGWNSFSGRQNSTFAHWQAKQSQFFHQAEEWMYRVIPTDRSHPEYLQYSSTLQLLAA